MNCIMASTVGLSMLVPYHVLQVVVCSISLLGVFWGISGAVIKDKLRSIQQKEGCNMNSAVRLEYEYVLHWIIAQNCILFEIRRDVWR